ncbi:Ger(x)C family spore germination protein [Clostridium aciditolerans]|uniref:Ger(X)C family spore germination protein n=1 Tax=Clostridium aciditolerans TaxID=339861 RepID=A0A934M0T2_9CLOT|nr:Ger(x)C family spore germination protein [Clostridium aciditolerans]MBI6872504.1 Ger(x)C family spore germination protein [Clostridium aciditolerans]
MKEIKMLAVIVIIPIMLSGCYNMRPQEDLGIIIGLGYDIENQGVGYKYKDTSETFIFKGEKKIEHEVLSGRSKSIYSTENELQMKFNKKWIAGTEIVYLIGEERARYGIKDIIDGQIRDPIRREIAAIAVSQNTAENVYKLEPKSASTIAEELRGILRFIYMDNFFPIDNEVSEFLKMYYQEGRKVVIPYINVIDNRPQVTGLALFRKDKMVRKVSLDEARLINILRNNDGFGYLAINKPERNEYYEAYFKNKNKLKVKVSKEGNNLKYDIFVTLIGDLKVDTIDKNLITKKEVKDIEKAFAEDLQKKLEIELGKMQKEYQTDWIDIGKYAAAKYGRQGNYASDEAFCDAIIDVHVNVKVATIGQKKK